MSGRSARGMGAAPLRRRPPRPSLRQRPAKDAHQPTGERDGSAKGDAEPAAAAVAEGVLHEVPDTDLVGPSDQLPPPDLPLGSTPGSSESLGGIKMEGVNSLSWYKMCVY